MNHSDLFVDATIVVLSYESRHVADVTFVIYIHQPAKVLPIHLFIPIRNVTVGMDCTTDENYGKSNTRTMFCAGKAPELLPSFLACSGLKSQPITF